MYVTWLSVLNDLNHDITFYLVIEFFAFIIMIILAGIGSTYYHYNKIFRVFIYTLVAYGRFQLVTVFVDPFLQVEGGRQHLSDFPAARPGT